MANVRLFRFVSTQEQLAIRLLGRLHPGPNSCEGKHFALSLEHALRWGDLLYDGDGVVIEVVIAEEHFKKLYYIGPNVDNIGPACFAEESLLPFCKVDQVHE